MNNREQKDENLVANDPIYADENVQKFLTLLVEIIVDLTLKEYEHQKRHRIPPHQPGTSE
jgi:hypothetical protein